MSKMNICQIQFYKGDKVLWIIMISVLRKRVPYSTLRQAMRRQRWKEIREINICVIVVYV